MAWPAWMGCMVVNLSGALPPLWLWWGLFLSSFCPPTSGDKSSSLLLIFSLLFILRFLIAFNHSQLFTFSKESVLFKPVSLFLRWLVHLCFLNTWYVTPTASMLPSIRIHPSSLLIKVDYCTVCYLVPKSVCCSSVISEEVYPTVRRLMTQV